MAKGGKRPGSGRKPGKALRLLDLLKKGQIDEFIEFLIDNYKEDSRLMIWMGDHIFGKAPQAIDLTTKGKELPQPLLHVLNNNGHQKGGSAGTSH